MPRKNSYITVKDQFCGSGGSSQGARAAGAEIKVALNHWKLAIETHNTNFPEAMHDCTDISASDPRRYPSTDILITSPECTNHSLAKGVKIVKKQMDMFASMAFEPDYVVLGNSRDQVKQLGNAVTPPVMEWLVRQVIQSLS